AYTIGQRKGLGIASTEPYYVIDKDIKNNKVIIGRMEDQFRKSLNVKDVNLIAFDKLDKDLNCNVKIRYKHKETPARLIPIEENKIKVEFSEPQKAITKGQSAVFYDGEYVLGGGIIE
ncbi:MAG: tRNA 2-thiouridine(34) synthase MnmA, partial [Clostridia bacterium]|nr:tRNA 2-thiouridine(34) synthase MnmA [Clostridia bacterium]